MRRDFSAAPNCPEGIPGEAEILIDAALFRTGAQSLLECVGGAFEAIGDVEGAAGEVPCIEIARVETLRGFEKALCGIPLLARGGDAACEYIAFRVAGVESDGAVGFVECGLKLVEVQEGATEVDADIGTVGKARQVVAVQVHGVGRAQGAIGGVGGGE